jgi:AAA+ ATPase superfamily predicted ATPase
MFVGRNNELEALEALYEKHTMQMVVVYGRRRVGKTTLLAHFTTDKPAIFFTAQESNDAANLKAFSQALYKHAGLPTTTGSFESWDAAFSFLADVAKDQQLILVFDEFPYAAQANSSLPSILQRAIDHEFSKGRLFLLLSGSNVGFMESDVLGSKSPLYGRRTAQIHLLPFDYHDAALMLQGATQKDCIRYYSCLGGVPYYLSFVDTQLTFEDNIIALFFKGTSVFAQEPLMLLRQELREPALYNTILTALAKGANTPQLIANQIGEDRTKLIKYLDTLKGLGLIDKFIPLLTNQAKTRKGIYRISDPLFAFWYRFIFPLSGEIDLGNGEIIARKKVLPVLPELIGRQFEDICIQWLRHHNGDTCLPFTATAIGPWWGTDPRTKQQTDIDILAIDTVEKKALLGECKWRESFNAWEALNTLIDKAGLFSKRQAVIQGGDKTNPQSSFREFWFYLFSKSPFDLAIRQMAQEDGHVKLVGLDELFQ